jgi:uncharacterized protein YutE (UPF0331/DUF86 family)
MVNPEVVLEKLRHIRTSLQRIADKNPRSREELFGNPDVQDVVLRNMQNALQGCLDIASHIVSDEGWGQPSRATDFFVLLGEHKILKADLAKTLARLIKFRNILVHEYTNLDFEKTWQAVSSGVAQIESFCQAVVSWMEHP